VEKYDAKLVVIIVNNAITHVAGVVGPIIIIKIREIITTCLLTNAITIAQACILFCSLSQARAIFVDY
jgi:hypothetical protein